MQSMQLQSLSGVLDPLEIEAEGNPRLELVAARYPRAGKPLLLFLEADGITASRQLSRADAQAMRDWLTNAIVEIDKRIEVAKEVLA